MQTLAMPPVPATPANAAVSAKSETATNAASRNDGKTPFQMELSRQVRAKASQTPGKQTAHSQKQAPQQARQDPNQNAKVISKAAELSNEKVAVVDSVTADGKGLDSVQTLLPDNAATATQVDDKNPDYQHDVLDALGIGLNDAKNIVLSAPVPLQAALANINTVQTGADKVAGTLAREAAVSPEQDKNIMLADTDMTAEAAEKPATSVVGQGSKADGLSNADAKLALSEHAATKLANNAVKELAVKDLQPTQPLTAAVAQSQLIQNNTGVAAQHLASTNVIDVYPGKPGWDQAISQKVIYMVGASQQSATLTLNPPDLGPLKVVINVHNEQADATFISDNDEVRRALESGLSHLREKMSESGVQLGQTSISSNRQSQQDFQQAAQNRGALTSSGANGGQQAGSETQPGVASRVANGLVDTFA
ncbi:MAG: flagellar hook-length control protein FliK [Betaproteobacteria bacterium HGW-Betaproteobacteria-22]|nr:MAG: flagellar hook-length control protein FliK [Betaproteobacteria bacterium HGW-Betaproteobacteria-22]